MSTTALIVLIVVIVAAAVVVWMMLQKRKSQTLRNRFGPEYERALHQYGARSQAEKELERRAERREKYHIRMLTTEEQHAFSKNWQSAQARFVDDPRLAIREADHLVSELMGTRGYPMADFDRRAEDLSVDHPHVVRNYRAAHRIAVMEQENRASTEDLRQAMVSYRQLFDELLEGEPAGMHARRS